MPTPSSPSVKANPRAEPAGEPSPQRSARPPRTARDIISPIVKARTVTRPTSAASNRRSPPGVGMPLPTRDDAAAHHIHGDSSEDLEKLRKILEEAHKGGLEMAF